MSSDCLPTLFSDRHLVDSFTRNDITENIICSKAHYTLRTKEELQKCRPMAELSHDGGS